MARMEASLLPSRRWFVTHAAKFEDGDPTQCASDESDRSDAKDSAAYWRSSSFHAGTPIRKPSPQAYLAQREFDDSVAVRIRADIVVLRRIWPYLCQYVTILGYDLSRLGVTEQEPSSNDSNGSPMTWSEREALFIDVREQIEHRWNLESQQQHASTVTPNGRIVHGLHYLGAIPRFFGSAELDDHDHHPARIGLAVCLNEVSSGTGFSVYAKTTSTKLARRSDVDFSLIPKVGVEQERAFLAALPEKHCLLVLGAKCTSAAFNDLSSGLWQWEQQIETGGNPADTTRVVRLIDQAILEFDWFGYYGNPLHYVMTPEARQGFLWQHGFSTHSMPRFLPRCVLRKTLGLQPGDALAIQHVTPTVSPAVRIFHGSDPHATGDTTVQPPTAISSEYPRELNG